MSKILHAAQSMSPTIGRKKVSKKDSNDNIGKLHSRCESRGGPGGPGPPLTLGFEAPKLSIFGPY